MSGVSPTVVISSSRRLRSCSGVPALPCRVRERVRKCSIRWTGLSEPKGSWNTICSCDRYSLDAWKRSRFSTSVPLSRIRPAVGFSSRAMQRARVLLPRAGLPHEGHDLAFPDGEVHTAEGAHRGP